MRSTVCQQCHGVGWLIEVEEGLERAVPCPECRLRLAEAERLRQARIPPRYFDRGFDVYSIQDSSQEKALRRAIDYVEAFPEVPRGLLFIGPCGVGKTHLSVALLKAIVQNKEATGRFVDEAEFLRRLQYSYGPDSPDTEREVLLPLMDVDLLVWDDLGTGRPTDWVRETVRMVINHRYTYKKQTIMSSNWPFKPVSGGSWGTERSGEQSLSERVGKRLLSRIMEMCEVVEINGPDARTVIHKAGMDFHSRSLSRKPALHVPPGLLQCPPCGAKQVRILDQSDRKGSGAKSYLELYCVCEQCSEHFLARFFPRTAKVEYPATADENQ